MGKLRDAIRPFQQTFPDTPLWITEVGVESEHAIGPEHYGRIANYMGEMVEEIAVEHADYVPVLIWFAWNDVMRNAGMLTADGKEKPHVYDAYRTMRDWGIPQFESADALAGLPLPSAFIGFDSTLTDYNAVPADHRSPTAGAFAIPVNARGTIATGWCMRRKMHRTTTR